MKHSKLSASSSHRWLACQGSVARNWGEDRVDNEYSLLGKSAHALLEVCLRMGSDPEDFIGVVLEEGYMVVDEAMADSVGYALDYVRAYVSQYPKTKVLVEQTVKYGASIGCSDDDAFGTSDILLDNYPTELVAIDYKHGIGIVVSVKDNTQIRLYLAGQRQARGRYQRYRAVVIQPRVPRRKPVQEAPGIKDTDLTKWLDKEVRPIVPIILDKNGKFRPNAPRLAGEHCTFCHANGNCTAQFELVQQKAAKEFKTKDPNKLTPADMAKMLDLLKTISVIGDATKERAIAAIHAGVNIPGYRKSWTPSRRMWSDTEDANECLEGLGLATRERYTVELLSPAQAEKVLRAKKLWPKSKRGEQKPDSPIDAVVAYTDSNPSIERAPDTAQ